MSICSCKKAHSTHSQVTPLTPKALSAGRVQWILRFTFLCPHYMLVQASVHPPVLIGSPPSQLTLLSLACSQLSPASQLAPLTPALSQLTPAHSPHSSSLLAHSSSLQLAPSSLPDCSQWAMNSLVCIGVLTTSGGQGLGCKLGVSWERAGASWSEMSEPNVILGFRVSFTIGGKSWIITYSTYVSPPPGSKVPTQCPLT